jgi:hypothetical protein
VWARIVAARDAISPASPLLFAQFRIAGGQLSTQPPGQSGVSTPAETLSSPDESSRAAHLLRAVHVNVNVESGFSIDAVLVEFYPQSKTVMAYVAGRGLVSK